MNTLSRCISGIAVSLLGLGLTIAAFASSLFLLIYGLPLLVIGVFIFFNKREDEIEKIRDE